MFNLILLHAKTSFEWVQDVIVCVCLQATAPFLFCLFLLDRSVCIVNKECSFNWKKAAFQVQYQTFWSVLLEDLTVI